MAKILHHYIWSLSDHIPTYFIHPRLVCLVCSININVDVICSHSCILYECKGEKARLQYSYLRRLGLKCRVCLDVLILYTFFQYVNVIHRCIVLVVVHDYKNLSSNIFLNFPGIQRWWFGFLGLGVIPSLPNPRKIFHQQLTKRNQTDPIQKSKVFFWGGVFFGW